MGSVNKCPNKLYFYNLGDDLSYHSLISRFHKLGDFTIPILFFNCFYSKSKLTSIEFSEPKGPLNCLRNEKSMPGEINIGKLNSKSSIIFVTF